MANELGGTGRATIREVFFLLQQNQRETMDKLDEAEDKLAREMNEMRERHHQALQNIGDQLIRLSLELEEHRRSHEAHGVPEAIAHAKEGMEALAKGVARVVASGSILVLGGVVTDILVRLLRR